MTRPASNIPNRVLTTRLSLCYSCVAIAASIAAVLTWPNTKPNQTTQLLPVRLITQPTNEQEPKKQSMPSEGIRECVITLKSGRTISGELIREDTRIVVIGIEGIETTFQRKNVANIVILPPVTERYEQLRETIAEDDVDSRLALVEWLRARRAYKLALRELEAILLIEPGNPQAKLLQNWLSENNKLLDEKQAPASKNSKANTESEEPPNPRKYQIKRNELKPLSDDEINLMRVFEIDLRDLPQVRVPDEVMLELMRMHPDSFSPNEDERRQLLDEPGIEKLKLLFSLKARSLYPRVEISENPESLARFKDQVHHGRGWLINACASTRCHGGVDAGSFRLINSDPNTDETAFTNLYIIEQTTLKNGQPLIDYKNPQRSALLQMGMIRSNALIPHPELPRDYPGSGFRPIFRNTRERKYQQAVDWIRSMYQPRPQYNFEYTTLPKPNQSQPDASTKIPQPDQGP